MNEQFSEYVRGGRFNLDLREGHIKALILQVRIDNLLFQGGDRKERQAEDMLFGGTTHVVRAGLERRGLIERRQTKSKKGLFHFRLTRPGWLVVLMLQEAGFCDDLFFGRRQLAGMAESIGDVHVLAETAPVGLVARVIQ